MRVNNIEVNPRGVQRHSSRFFQRHQSINNHLLLLGANLQMLHSQFSQNEMPFGSRDFNDADYDFLSQLDGGYHN